MPAKTPTAPADVKGLKRICPNCGTRYYDLGKRPILCPNCATEFSGEMKMKARRSRAAAVADEDEEAHTENAPDTARKSGGQETDEVETDEDTVSLDEVESLEAGDDDADDTLDEDLDDDLDEALDEEEADDLGDGDKGL